VPIRSSPEALLTESQVTVAAPHQRQRIGRLQGVTHLWQRAHRRAVDDVGYGRHLVQLLQLWEGRDKPLMAVRRTEIDTNGAMATTGRSDTVTATTKQDPAWTTASTIGCGDLTMKRDGVQAPF
jgi:hypothetical protein